MGYAGPALLVRIDCYKPIEKYYRGCPDHDAQEGNFCSECGNPIVDLPFIEYCTVPSREDVRGILEKFRDTHLFMSGEYEDTTGRDRKEFFVVMTRDIDGRSPVIYSDNPVCIVTPKLICREIDSFQKNFHEEIQAIRDFGCKCTVEWVTCHE